MPLRWRRGRGRKAVPLPHPAPQLAAVTAKLNRWLALPRASQERKSLQQGLDEDVHSLQYMVSRGAEVRALAPTTAVGCDGAGLLLLRWPQKEKYRGVERLAVGSGCPPREGADARRPSAPVLPPPPPLPPPLPAGL